MQGRTLDVHPKFQLLVGSVVSPQIGFINSSPSNGPLPTDLFHVKIQQLWYL